MYSWIKVLFDRVWTVAGGRYERVTMRLRQKVSKKSADRLKRTCATGGGGSGNKSPKLDDDDDKMVNGADHAEVSGCHEATIWSTDIVLLQGLNVGWLWDHDWSNLRFDRDHVGCNLTSRFSVIWNCRTWHTCLGLYLIVSLLWKKEHRWGSMYGGRSMQNLYSKFPYNHFHSILRDLSIEGKFASLHTPWPVDCSVPLPALWP